MKEALKLSIALGLFCAVASSVLAVAEMQTRAATEGAKLRQKQAALLLVLPDFDNRPLEDSVECEGVTFYRATKDGVLVGLAAQGQTDQGFGGTVKVLTGIIPDGRLGAVLVTEHKETPGLGTQVTDRKQPKSIWDLLKSKPCCGAADGAGLPPNKHLDQYRNKDIVTDAPFDVKNDGGKIDAVSGATISSRAVADAITNIGMAFAQHRKTILPEPAPGSEDAQ